ADLRTVRLRTALRADAAGLAEPVQRKQGRGPRARLRRRLHPDVAVLPVLRRGRVPGRVPERQPAHDGAAMTAPTKASASAPPTPASAFASAAAGPRRRRPRR